jgi:hypothetical protein
LRIPLIFSRLAGPFLAEDMFLFKFEGHAQAAARGRSRASRENFSRGVVRTAFPAVTVPDIPSSFLQPNRSCGYLEK